MDEVDCGGTAMRLIEKDFMSGFKWGLISIRFSIMVLQQFKKVI